MVGFREADPDSGTFKRLRGLSNGASSFWASVSTLVTNPNSVELTVSDLSLFIVELHKVAPVTFWVSTFLLVNEEQWHLKNIVEMKRDSGERILQTTKIYDDNADEFLYLV